MGLGGHEWVWEGVVGFGMAWVGLGWFGRAWVGLFVYLMNNFDLERYCF